MEAECLSNLKRSMFFPFASCFACLLPFIGHEPDRRRSRTRGRRCNADRRLSRPKPTDARCRNFHQRTRSPNFLLLALENAACTHHTKMLRKMPSRTVLSAAGNRKNFMIDHYAYGAVDHYSESKIKSLLVV